MKLLDESLAALLRIAACPLLTCAVLVFAAFPRGVGSLASASLSGGDHSLPPKSSQALARVLMCAVRPRRKEPCLREVITRSTRRMRGPLTEGGGSQTAQRRGKVERDTWEVAGCLAQLRQALAPLLTSDGLRVHEF